MTNSRSEVGGRILPRELEHDDEVEERRGEEHETRDANSFADVLVVTENPREETDAGQEPESKGRGDVGAVGGCDMETEDCHKAERDGDPHERGHDGKQRPEPGADGDSVLDREDEEQADQDTAYRAECERQGRIVLGKAGGRAQTASAGDHYQKLQERGEDLQKTDGVALALPVSPPNERSSLGGAGIDGDAAEAGEMEQQLEQPEEEPEHAVRGLGKVSPENLVDVDLILICEAVALKAVGAILVAGDFASTLVVFEQHLGVAAARLAGGGHGNMAGGDALLLKVHLGAGDRGEVDALLFV